MSCQTFNDSEYSSVGNSLSYLTSKGILPLNLFNEAGYSTPEEYSTDLRNWNYRSVAERYNEPEILNTSYKHSNFRGLSFDTLQELNEMILSIDYSCSGSDAYFESTAKKLSDKLVLRINHLIENSIEARKENN